MTQGVKILLVHTWERICQMNVPSEQLFQQSQQSKQSEQLLLLLRPPATDRKSFRSAQCELSYFTSRNRNREKVMTEASASPTILQQQMSLQSDGEPAKAWTTNANANNALQPTSFPPFSPLSFISEYFFLSPFLSDNWEIGSDIVEVAFRYCVRTTMGRSFGGYGKCTHNRHCMLLRHYLCVV